MPVNFRNAVRVSRIIAIDVINDVGRLCFGGALLGALFKKKKNDIPQKNNKKWKTYFLHRHGLSTLRVGRSVTRLTVHLAL